MTSQRFVVLGVLCLLLGSISAMAAGSNAAALEARNSAAVDGMLCVTDQGLKSPEVVPDERNALSGGGGGPKCPVNFSHCNGVPGRSCSLQNCVTIDLGYSSCRKPGGIIISCTGGNLQQTTCDCLERFHSTCCDDGTCSFGDCGTCTGGSLTTVCP